MNCCCILFEKNKQTKKHVHLIYSKFYSGIMLFNVIQIILPFHSLRHSFVIIYDNGMSSSSSQHNTKAALCNLSTSSKVW